MSTDTHSLETVYWSDGWLEIRDSDRPSAWIAADSPAAVEP
jgi:hypothetical protein